MSWINQTFMEMLGQFIGGKPTLSSEILEWIIAFCIAYMIIKHGGQIIGGIGDASMSITKLAGMFLAV